MAPLDFVDRRQYLHARGTLTRLLELGVVPVVNENDAIADDEIRFGDNDRIAALVAHLVGADTLVLLTDTPGLLTADPRLDAEASLIEEIVEVDHELEAVAGGAGTVRGSGGMSTKVAAAKIAVVVRGAHGHRRRPTATSVLADAVAGVAGVGTVVLPRDRHLRRPQAVDRLRRRLAGHHHGRRRGPPGPAAGRHLAAGRRGHRRDGRRSTPTTRSRWPAPTAWCSPRA